MGMTDLQFEQVFKLLMREDDLDNLHLHPKQMVLLL